MGFYPKAESVATVTKADKATFAAEIIKQIDTRDIKITNGNNDNVKAQIIGDVLKGSHDVATFNEAFADVVKERVALMSVSGKDAAEYAAKVSAIAVYADKAKWCAEAAKVGLVGLVEAKEI